MQNVCHLVKQFLCSFNAFAWLRFHPFVDISRSDCQVASAQKLNSDAFVMGNVKGVEAFLAGLFSSLRVRFNGSQRGHSHSCAKICLPNCSCQPCFRPLFTLSLSLSLYLSLFATDLHNIPFHILCSLLHIPSTVH
jgi:hypothetical protein